MCHQWTEQFRPIAGTQQPHSQLKAPEKTGQGFKKNVKKTKTGAQKWVPKTDPKMGPAFAPTIRILLKPESEAHLWVHFWDPKMGTKIEQKCENFLERILKKSARVPKKKTRRKIKPRRLEISILWVHVLACFPKSRFHLAAKVHAYLAPKADACGCDHSKGGPVLLHYACNHVAIRRDRIQHVTLKPQP